MKKKLLLKAVKHNWGMMRLGTWRSVTWKLYTDRTCLIAAQYLPKWDQNDLKDESPNYRELLKSKEVWSRSETLSCEK